MAYTTIDDPSAYFHTRLYTGNGSTQSITNNANAGDFAPDWLWIKGRSDADNNSVFDTTRGANEELVTNGTGAEATGTNLVTSFDTNGFSLGNNAGVNGSGDTYVAWQWKANGGTTSSVSASGNGTDADTTKAGTYQANTTAGFSIVTFSTGAISTGDHRIEHGLGAVPHFIITKSLDTAAPWYTYHHKGTDDNDYLRLNLTNATSNAGSRNVFDGSDFTSTYFEMDYNNILLQNENYVAYCFTEIQGYSKFGSYTGNGNADGPFIYTGFKPAFVIIKRTDSANSWTIRDSKRSTFNVMQKSLFADLNNAEADSSSYNFDFLSNGFKQRNANGIDNASGGTYLYLAFASSPFVSSEGVPTTAR